jgi:probable rRNA maturation factor
VPRSPYTLEWHLRPSYEAVVKRRSLSTLARQTLAAEQVEGPLVLSVAIVDNRTIRSLNRRWLGLDAATDVLSFALGRHQRLDDDRILGEVVIALPTARRQASEAAHSLDDELAHLLVHGILHILGYDHETKGDARRMRTREESLLGRTAH